MKYFKGILVVSVVFLFPLGSYLYLRSGFNYRKQALEELKNKTELSKSQVEILENSTDSDVLDRVWKGITLIQKVSSEKDIKDALFVAENLTVRPDFQLIAFTDRNQSEFLNDTIYQKTLHRIEMDNQTFNQFFEENRFILLKDSLIRNTYGSTIEDMKTVYEHTVILLPVKKRDKITLERDAEI